MPYLEQESGSGVGLLEPFEMHEDLWDLAEERLILTELAPDDHEREEDWRAEWFAFAGGHEPGSSRFED